MFKTLFITTNVEVEKFMAAVEKAELKDFNFQKEAIMVLMGGQSSLSTDAQSLLVKLQREEGINPNSIMATAEIDAGDTVTDMQDARIHIVKTHFKEGIGILAFVVASDDQGRYVQFVGILTEWEVVLPKKAA